MPQTVDLLLENPQLNLFSQETDPDHSLKISQLLSEFQSGDNILRLRFPFPDQLPEESDYIKGVQHVVATDQSDIIFGTMHSNVIEGKSGNDIIYGMSGQMCAIWYGILVVKMAELCLITPPIGLNCFVVAGVRDDLTVHDVFRGVTPFFIADALTIIILVMYPSIVLWLPSQVG